MVFYSSFAAGIALSALLVCFATLMFTVLDGHTRKPQNRVYISLLLLLAVNAVCELINYRYSPSVQQDEGAYRIVRIAQYIYFLSHCLIAPLLFYYISFVIGRSVGIGVHRGANSITANFLRSFVPISVVVLTELFVLFNPLTHWCWYYDENRVFHRAWGEYVFVYSLSVLWIAAAFVLAMLSWNILSKGRKRSLAICYLLAGAGIVIQLLSENYRVEVLMEALGFSGALLFIENEDDRRNVELDAYNSAAFSLDVTAIRKNRIPVQILIVRDIGSDTAADNRSPGAVTREAIGLAVSEYLGTVVRRYFIYAIGGGRFALTLYNYSDDAAHQLAQTIQRRFESPWHISGTDTDLAARIMLVRMPENAQSAEDVLYIARCPIPALMQETILEGKSLDWITRRSAVEQAVLHGLEQGSFEVYYQPTYNLDKTLHGAEALLRMEDKTLGRIFPDEFIPVAEELGMVNMLDEFVLREVCAFLRTGIPQRSGMECINVNLSVLECMREGFADHVRALVETYGVRRQMINFEITESVDAKDYSRLAKAIDRLKQDGFLFSIDDYGTGYSNITSLFSLGVDIIKIDKSILWNAEKSKLGMTLLETTVRLVHRMKKKALMEGVETEAHMELLRALGCDYLQGFYFAKPLTRAEFLRHIGQQEEGE